MWAGGMAAPAAYAQPMMGQQQQQQQQQQKHDIFVGNLAFNTTEEQLLQSFSEIGRVIKVRLVTDAETGKPRGFAFVEFEDPQAALSAIRNMNDYELNGRRIRVNFSNSSHLEALAGKLGMDLSQQTQQRSSGGAGGGGTSLSNNQIAISSASGSSGGGAGINAVSDALKAMSKGEMYDVVEKLKEIADRDPDEARRILSGHPQLPEAILFLMSKLDMVQTSAPTDGGAAAAVLVQSAPVPMPAGRAADPRARKDPRAAAVAAAAALDPRAAAATVAAPPPPPPARVDPRARLDPRAARAAAPPPIMGMPQPPSYGAVASLPPPAGLPPPPPPAGGVANLDPALVQQVMSLTPQQISQLPPDKQQSIIALRQQIQGAGR